MNFEIQFPRTTGSWQGNNQLQFDASDWELLTQPCFGLIEEELAVSFKHV